MDGINAPTFFLLRRSPIMIAKTISILTGNTAVGTLINNPAIAMANTASTNQLSIMTKIRNMACTRLLIITPVKSAKSRILVTLNYNEEKDIELSENARLTFFGRK